jgi:SAM-dependent methyltransferase
MTNILYEGRDLEALANMPNYYSWIMDTFAPHITGHVIEYGAGAGTVSSCLVPFATKLTLIEPSPNLAGILRRRFGPLPQVEVIDASLEQHSLHLRNNSVDTIVLVNVLEHIEDDHAALTQLIGALKPGGRLLLFVPALQLLMSKLDKMVGHFRRYHKAELAHKVQAAGGDITLCRYFDLIGVAPWLVLNRLLGSTSFNPAFVAINDRFVVPVSRTIERIGNPPFGKNLILVATKKAAV